jgi:hypothetical protein
VVGIFTDHVSTKPACAFQIENLSLPFRERQDVRFAFRHAIRGYAETLLGDHDNAT